MNQFIRASTNALLRHGINVTYKSTGASSYDPATSLVTASEVSKTVRVYPKQTRFTTFNHPDLIGKEGILFYLAASKCVTPKLSDIIVYNSSNYIVQSIQSHFANGEIALYKILTIRG
jgi:hypothetical protein